MPTVKEMIDEYGKPPTDLCVDWAFQVQAAASTSNELASQAVSSGQAHTENIDLSTVQIDPQGLLSWPSGMDRQALLEQFLAWANDQAVDLQASGAPEDLLQTERVAALVLQLRPDAISKDVSPGAAPRSVLESIAAEKNVSDSQLPGNTQTQKRSPSRRFSRLAVRGSLLSTGLVVAIIGWFAFFQPAVDPLAFIGSRGDASQNMKPDRQPTDAMSGQAEFVNEESELELLARQTAGTDTTAQISAKHELADDLSEMRELAATIDPSNTTQKFGNSSADHLPGVEAVPEKAENAVGNSLSTVISLGGLPQEATELANKEPANILEQLSTIDAGIGKVKESEIASVGKASPPPLTIDVFPILQKHRVEHARRLRIAEPVWELTIRCSEDLQVIPEHPVLLKRKSPAFWRIIAPKGDFESDAEIAIQAELLQAKGTVRWRVWIRSPEYPNVVIPASEKFLEQAEALLIRNVNLLSRQSQAFDSYAKIQDLPVEIKAVIRRRVSLAEGQLEIAQALLQVVLDGRKLRAWSDGIFEIHGKIFDQRSPQPTALVEFGEQQMQLKTNEATVDGQSR